MNNRAGSDRAGSNRGWLSTERAELAAEQILDAAGLLFAERGVASVGMAEVASSAGCSRATLYRYFENRDALRTAFVHREARRVAGTVAEAVAHIAEPAEQLASAMVMSLRLVRDDATLAAWFIESESGLAARAAQSSEVIERLVAGLLGGRQDAVTQRRARWVVRVLVSLLALPEADEDDERALIDEFVVPVIAYAD